MMKKKIFSQHTRMTGILLVAVMLICQFSLIFNNFAFAAEANLALNKPVEVSGYEGGFNDDGTLVYPQFAKDHLTDGNLSTRWSSDTSLTSLDLSQNPSQNVWAYVDLGQTETIGKVVLRWQLASARNYDIQISDDAQTWTTIEHYEHASMEIEYAETLNLDIPVQARYVRVYARVGTYLTALAGYCRNVSLYEIEVYEEPQPPSELDAVLSKVISSDPVISPDGTHIILPDPEDDSITVSIFGSGNRAVVNMDGKVTQPLTDMEVNIFYEVSNAQGDSRHSNKANHITIAGKYNPDDSVNDKPNVVPGLREWFGKDGEFKLTGNIVLADETLRESAEMTAAYLKEMVGKDITIVTGIPAAGDIYFVAGNNVELGDEGYEIEIADILTVTAPTAKGALYAGASISQILQQSNDRQSIPKGLVRDYPQYEIRAFMMDLARFYMPIDYLEEVAKYAAYFKVNELHAHINDNGGEQAAAFRVESKKYPGINEGIIAYSQDEYRNFQKEVRKYGVDVVTEIDTPAHSGFVSKVRPDLMLDGYHINLSNPESAAFIKELYDEFLDGDDPVFQSSKFHIGTDEYDKSYSEVVRAYMDEMIRYINSKGLEPRFWATLGGGGFAGTTPVSTDAVANLWAHSEASFPEMLDDGYKFINDHSGALYIVPGSSIDRLSLTGVYNNWEVSDLGMSYTLEPGHPQLLGSEACIWNDYKNGHSEFDYFDRVRVQLMLMAEKNWYGEKTEGQTGAEFAERVDAVDKCAPNANPARYVESQGDVVAEYDFKSIENNKAADLSGNGYDATLNGLSAGNGAVNLNGSGYISLPFDTLGYPYTVSMDITIDKDTPANAVLFDGKDGTFYYNYDNTGKLGYERKGYSYVIDFSLPTTGSINLTLTCTPSDIALYVDGCPVGTGMYYKVTGAHLQSSSTFVLPTEEIGSGIIGKLTSFKLYNRAISESEIVGGVDFKYLNLALFKDVEVSGVEGGYNDDGTLVYPQFDPKHAVDGNTDTRISFNRDNDAWLIVDLGSEYLIDKIQILFNETPNGYKVLTSLDGVTYEEVVSRPNIQGQVRVTETFPLNKLVLARYVKYQQIEMFTWGAARYSGNFTEFEVYGYETGQIQAVINDAKTAIAAATVTPENQGYIGKLESNVAELEAILGGGSLDNLSLLAAIILKQTNDLLDGNTVVYDVDCSALVELFDKVYSEFDFNADDGRLYKNMMAYAKHACYDTNVTQEKIDYIVSVISELTGKMVYITVWTNMGMYTDASTGYYYGIDYLYDGDPNTLTWFQGDQMPGNYVMFNFKDSFMLSSVSIQTFGVGPGGDILGGGIIEVSMDNITWTKVADVGGNEDQTVTFDEIEVKMIRIVVTELKARWWRLNEVLFNGRTLVDRTGLQHEVNNILPELAYKADSYKPYKEAIEEAKVLIANNNTTKAQVDALMARIAQAKLNLDLFIKGVLLDTINEAQALVGSNEYNKTYQFIRDYFDEALSGAIVVYNDALATEDMVIDAWYKLVDAIHYLAAEPADYAKLAILVDLAGNLDLSKYNVGVQAFEAALANAKGVLADMFAGKAEVDAAYTALLNAIAAMRYEVNKSMLQDLYDKVSGINTALYTAESAQVFNNALALAKATLLNPDSTQEEVDYAYKVLKDAEERLVPLGSESKGNESSSDASAPDSSKAKDADSSASSAPKTGDYSSVALIFFIALAGTAVLFTKRGTVKK